MTGRWQALALWLVATAALAADPPQPPPAAPASATSPAPRSAATPPAPAASAAATEPGKDAAAAGDKPPAPRAIGPTPQRFTPTDKVRADIPVSFPIDI